MPAQNNQSVHQLLEGEISLPIGQFIFQTAAGIADAQLAMDQSSMFASQMMSGKILSEKNEFIDTRVPFPKVNMGQRQMDYFSLFELGFIPAFYQFVENELELKVSMRLRDAKESATKLETIPLDAAYINRYNFNMRGASTLKVKLIPVPPPINVNLDKINSEILNQGTNKLDYASSAYCLNASVSILKGLGEQRNKKLRLLKIVKLEQLIHMNETALESLSSREKIVISELIHKAKMICYPALFLPITITEFSNMRMNELIEKSEFFLKKIPDKINQLQMEKYLLLLKLCIDKDILNKVNVQIFFA